MPYPSMVNPGVQVEPTTPTTPSFAFPSVVPNPAFPNTSPAQPRELPFSTPPALPGGRELPPVPQAPMGGGLPPISRTPPGLQGAYGDIPLSPASLGPVIE